MRIEIMWTMMATVMSTAGHRLESRSGRIFGTQPQPNSHLGKNKAIKKIPTDLDLSR